MAWAEKKIQITEGFLPVIWECPAAVRLCAAGDRSAVLLNDRPPLGMQSVYIDSVSTDDFSGGVCAAQILQQKAGARQGSGKIALLNGHVAQVVQRGGDTSAVAQLPPDRQALIVESPGRAKIALIIGKDTRCIERPRAYLCSLFSSSLAQESNAPLPALREMCPRYPELFEQAAKP